MCGVRSPAEDVRRAVWAAPSQRGAQTALRVSSLVTNALSKGGGGLTGVGIFVPF